MENLTSVRAALAFRRTRSGEVERVVLNALLIWRSALRSALITIVFGEADPPSQHETLIRA